MKLAVIISVILGGIYLFLFSSASNGYGYAGYNGYNSGPSFFYFGGPSIYSDNNRTVRSGSGGRNGSTRSVSSSRFRGGGPSGGK